NDVRRFPVRDLASSTSEALGGRIIRMLVQGERTNEGELTALHVEAVRELAQSGENGKLLQLPGGVEVRRDDDLLVFLPRASGTARQKQSREFAYSVELRNEETVVTVKEIGCAIRFRSIDWPLTQRETKENGWAALDRHKLRDPLVLRSLRPGDRMRP